MTNTVEWSPEYEDKAEEAMLEVVGNVGVEVQNYEAKRIRVLHRLMTDKDMSLDEAKEHEDYQKLLEE